MRDCSVHRVCHSISRPEPAPLQRPVAECPLKELFVQQLRRRVRLERFIVSRLEQDQRGRIAHTKIHRERPIIKGQHKRHREVLACVLRQHCPIELTLLIVRRNGRAFARLPAIAFQLRESPALILNISAAIGLVKRTVVSSNMTAAA